MPSEPRRTSPLTVLVYLLVVGGALVGMAVSAVVNRVAPVLEPLTGGDTGGPPLPLIGLVALSFARIVQWWFTTYQLDAEHLVVSSGIIRRERRSLPYARVQQVGSRRQFTDQLLGLERLTVQTAGVGDEIKLEALTRAEAERVRSFIEDRRTATPPAVDPIDALAAGVVTDHGAPVTWQEVHRLSPAQVVLASVLSPSVWGTLSIALLIAIAAGVAAALGGAPTDSLVGMFFAAGLSLLITAQLLVGGVLTRWGMVVDLGLPDVVRIRSGLFDRREVRVPRRRVQWVRISSSPLHRRLGLVDVALHSAQALDGAASVEVPLVPTREIVPLLAALLGEERWSDVPHRELRPRPPAARRRAIVRRVVIVGAVAGLALVVPAAVAGGATTGLIAAVVAVAAAGLGVPWGRAAHRRAGFAAVGGTVTLASGVVVHRRDTVPVDRIQSSATGASWFARRRGLATISIDVAGSGAVALMDVDRFDAIALGALAVPRAEVVGGRP